MKKRSACFFGKKHKRDAVHVKGRLIPQRNHRIAAHRRNWAARQRSACLACPTPTPRVQAVSVVYLYVASVLLPLTGSGGDILEMATWPGMSISFSGTGDCISTNGNRVRKQGDRTWRRVSGCVMRQAGNTAQQAQLFSRLKRTTTTNA